MKLLVLGGGVFLGRAAIDAAVRGSHEVTVFFRGRARSTWPDGVEFVKGDSAQDVAELIAAWRSR